MKKFTPQPKFPPTQEIRNFELEQELVEKNEKKTDISSSDK